MFRPSCFGTAPTFRMDSQTPRWAHRRRRPLMFRVNSSGFREYDSVFGVKDLGFRGLGLMI